METTDLLRHQVIKNVMTLHPDNVVDHSINLWKQMQGKIVFIVGENGFNCLFARTLSLVQPAFPWLPADSSTPQMNHPFAELKKCLEEQSPQQANDANTLLLITFTDIFASLIGEPLTTKILYLAWDIKASKRSNKELNNE